MELTAVLEALAAYPDTPVEVVTDSQYVIGGATTWRHTWIRNGWRRPGRGGKSLPVKNEDLWKRLCTALDAGKVTLRWVKGHNGTRFNDMADDLAKAGAQEVAA
jgi:ribonuclease HI